jgi:hypothetical protein
MDLVEVLSFLFMLSTMELGRVSCLFNFLPVAHHDLFGQGILDRKPIGNTESNARRPKRLRVDLANEGY